MRLWRPHTTGILIGGVVVILIAIVVAFMVTHFQPKTNVRLGSAVFSVDLAADETSRVAGLSGVESLGSMEGLLMVFDTDDTAGIWMKDMKIPLDIVWLDSNKKVIYIVKNAAPELSTDKTFTPMQKARYVLEVPAGAVDKNGIKVGQTAVFKLEGDE